MLACKAAPKRATNFNRRNTTPAPPLWTAVNMYPRNAEAVARVAGMAAEKCSELDAKLVEDLAAGSTASAKPTLREQAAGQGGQ